MDAQKLWALPGSGTYFITLSKASRDTAGVGEGQGQGIPWVAMTPQGMDGDGGYQQVKHSCCKLGNQFGETRLKSWSSSHRESNHRRRLAWVSPRGGQLGASASQLGCEPGRTQQRGNSREESTWGCAILQYWSDRGLQSYLEKQEWRISRGIGTKTVFEGVFQQAMAGAVFTDEDGQLF